MTENVDAITLTVISPEEELLSLRNRVAALVDQNDTQRARIESLVCALAEKDNRLVELVQDAHLWADDNNLCGEFDRFMVEHDLPARRRTYRVRVSATVDLYIDMEATDADEAMESVDSDHVMEAIYGLTKSDLSSQIVDHTAEEADAQ